MVEASCINQFPSCNISKGEIRVSPAMASFTTYIAGLHKQLGNNTSPNGLGSTTSSLPPPVPTQALPTHYPRASTSPSDGPSLLPSQPTSSGMIMMFSGPPRILASSILLLQLLTAQLPQLLTALLLQVLTALKFSHPTSIPTLLPQYILLLLVFSH